MRITDVLMDAVFPPRENEAIIRSLSADAFLERLSPAERGEMPHSVSSLFPYDDGVVQACILEAKFEANEHAARLLGSALHDFLYEFSAELAAFGPSLPILIPIPLSKNRLRERGYNQTERVARFALEGMTSLALASDLLTRTRDTLPQTSLSGSARGRNMQNAFAASRTCDPHHTYIVLDDVVTTGHTLRAACEALRNSGAKRILPLTLAY